MHRQRRGRPRPHLGSRWLRFLGAFMLMVTSMLPLAGTAVAEEKPTLPRIELFGGTKLPKNASTTVTVKILNQNGVAPTDPKTVTFELTKEGSASPDDIQECPYPANWESVDCEIEYPGFPGKYQVIAVSTPGDIPTNSNSIEIEWVDASLTLTRTPTGDVSIGQKVTLTATLTPNIKNADVTFNVTGTHPQIVTKPSNSNGVATFDLTGEIEGEDIIDASAWFDGVTVSANQILKINWVAGPKVTLEPSSSSITRIVNTSAVITATVRNADNTPVSGGTLYYRITRQGTNTVENGTLTIGTGTNAGKAELSFSRSTTGTDRVQFWTDPGQPANNVDAAIDVIWISGGLTLTPEKQTVPLGTTATVTAQFSRSGGVISNQLIRYTVTGANTVTNSGRTDASGRLSIDFTRATAGTATITAWVELNGNTVHDPDEPRATAEITWQGTSLSLTPSSRTLSVGQEASFTATLQAATRNNIPLRYTVTGPNATSGVVTTNANGQATIKYTGNNAGTDTLSVYADLNNNGRLDAGEPQATATVVYRGATLTLSPTTQTHQTGAKATISAKLTNTDGPVANVLLWVSVTGPHGTTDAIYTDAAGNASFSITGAHSGTDTVTIYADLNQNKHREATEPLATVTVNWTSPGTPPPGSSDPPTVGFEPATPVGPKAGCTYHPETGHNLCAGFRDYWNAFGGLAIHGHPITEEFVDPTTGLVTQYFERSRFEWHPGKWPERFDVLLGLLGNELTEGRRDEAPFQRATPKNDPTCRYFVETGHNLCAGFHDFWNTFGGLAVYGMPISEEFQEFNADTGKVYTVQYFERQRVEWHPGEWPERYDTFLGRIGAQLLHLTYGTPYP